MYLEKFVLPINSEEMLLNKNADENGGYIDNSYPCGIFSRKNLYDIYFKNVTIFYGGNGSGKSTLLNLIAEKVKLNRIAPFNSSEIFSDYAKKCKFSLGIDDEGFQHRIPDGSRIITSDDIFDYMLAVRTNNNEISENKKSAGEEYESLKFGESIKLSGLQNYESFKLQNLARKKSVSRRQFIKKTLGTPGVLNSNGETALKYFEKNLRNDTLYCFDEPENSLSPKLQLELVTILEQMARYCGCQFIIATHSPFLLAMQGAKIYDLDCCPVETKEWWELENTKTYFEFFEKNRHLFKREN